MVSVCGGEPLIYRHIDEVLTYVNSKDRPLGLYFFTDDKQMEEKILGAEEEDLVVPTLTAGHNPSAERVGR